MLLLPQLTVQLVLLLQEIATIMRQKLNPIFILLNNGSYAVEEVRPSFLWK